MLFVPSYVIASTCKAIPALGHGTMFQNIVKYQGVKTHRGNLLGLFGMQQGGFLKAFTEARHQVVKHGDSLKGH